MAVEFYQTVLKDINNGATVDPRTANIDLTGHSLGGGLAGYVGAIYDEDALVFDSMTFELAANQTENGLLSEVRDLVYGTYGEDHRQQKFSRMSLMIASEIMMLPSVEVQKNIYALVKSITKSSGQDNQA